MTKESLLLTPGPLSTTASVKHAMLRDLGSRDREFCETVKRVRSGLLHVAGVDRELGFDSVIMQGSGTFAVESVCGSVVPPSGRLLVLINGAYGRRIETIARRLGISVSSRTWPEHRPISPDEVDHALTQDPMVTHVAVVHCETTTGVLNPLDAIGRVVKRHGKLLIVDAMSSFGGIPIDANDPQIDFLISSSNKCLEGVPGIAFVVFRTDALAATEGCARSFSLDLFDQWRTLESTGQFRFTPPTHVILACDQALRELAAEGGVAARHLRYRSRQSALTSGMRARGFREYVDPIDQGPIITTFFDPDAAAFDFGTFYAGLAAQGFVIYPGKVAAAPSFRIGTIGNISAADIDAFLRALDVTMRQMGLQLPLQ